MPPSSTSPRIAFFERFTPKVAWAFAVLVAGVMLALLLVGFPRIVAVWQLYWGKHTIYRLLYDDLGLSNAWASFFAVVGSFIYSLAWLPLMAWTTRLLALRFNTRQVLLAFVCWVAVYGHAPLLHALLGSNTCFSQTTGAAQKWYVIAPNGQIMLFDSGGYETVHGVQKKLVTPEICTAFARQRANENPHKLVADVTGIQFFDPATGQARVWYYQGPGGYELYDAAGYHPGTSEPLKPVTKDVVRKILASPPKRDCFDFNGERVCQ